jgi:hypothetical protein
MQDTNTLPPGFVIENAGGRTPYMQDTNTMRQYALSHKEVEKHLKCKVTTPCYCCDLMGQGWKNILNAR